MFLLFETIKIQNNKICNAEYHLERVFNTQKDLWGRKDIIYFENTLMNIQENHLYDLDSKQIYKLKIIYNADSSDFSITSYKPKIIQYLIPVKDDNLNYSYKFIDRHQIKSLIEKTYSKGTAKEDTDIIIIKNGFVTDSSYANLVFAKGDELFTPKECLLKGTKRAKYLKEGKIIEKSIRFDEIQSYDFVTIINAMLDLEDSSLIQI